MTDKIPEALAVLDDAFAELRAIDGHGSGSLSVTADRLDQARAAFAELHATVEALLAYRIGEYPSRGDIRDNCASRAQIDAVATALAAVETLP